MLRTILIWPDPLLKKKALPVSKVEDGTRTLIRDMFETMYDADGVGLAAPQVGVLERIIVLDTRPRDEGAQPLAMVNPVITATEGTAVWGEGCLSIPGENEDVERAETVTVRYLDESGAERELTTAGLLAIAIQHEVDHLDGVVFVDHVSTLKRELIRKRMKKLKTAEEKPAPTRAAALKTAGRARRS
jgi:peptide deformylase